MLLTDHYNAGVLDNPHSTESHSDIWVQRCEGVSKYVLILSKVKVLYSYSAFYPDRKRQGHWQISNL